jgi:hypothetical protein
MDQARMRWSGAAAVPVVTLAALLLASPALAAPPNDNFANAQAITPGTGNKTVNGTTAEATSEPGEPHHLSYPVGDTVSVWYSWEAGNEPVEVTVEACGDNNIIAGVAVYRGSSLGSLQQVAQADTGYCQPAPEASFTAAAGATYWIAVTSDTDAIVQGPFTLSLRAAPVPVFDGAVTQAASRSRVADGGVVTYTATLRNRGNVTFDAVWLHLFASRPNRERLPAKNIRYLSFRTTRGRCHRQTYFVEHKGVMCAIGRLPPGQEAVVKVKVRLRQSITHWASLDYQPGRGVPIFDDNTRNDERKLTTRVRN